MVKISDFLPRNLRHLEHSKLFKSLAESIAQFAENRIVDEVFLRKLVEVFAAEFDAAFDRAPVNSRILQVSDNSGIINYRYDRGYWSIVVPSTSVVVSDQSTGKTAVFKDKVNVSIEGSGGGLRKGKRKSESIKRAYSRQIAKDVRWNEEDTDESESELDDDSSDWEG